MYEPGVTHLRAAQIQFLQLLERAEVRQSLVGDQRVAEAQAAQPLHTGQLLHPFVVERRERDVERLQMSKRGQCVALDAGLAQRQLGEVGQVGDLFQTRVVEADAVEEVVAEGQAFERGYGREVPQLAAEVFATVGVAAPDWAGQMQGFEISQPAKVLQVGRVDVAPDQVDDGQPEIPGR